VLLHWGGSGRASGCLGGRHAHVAVGRQGMQRWMAATFLSFNDMLFLPCLPCLPCQATPCPARPIPASPALPCHALPRRATPRPASPCLPCLAVPRPATPCLATPCLPCHALPSHAYPRHAKPCLPRLAAPIRGNQTAVGPFPLPVNCSVHMAFLRNAFTASSTMLNSDSRSSSAQIARARANAPLMRSISYMSTARA